MRYGVTRMVSPVLLVLGALLFLAPARADGCTGDGECGAGEVCHGEESCAAGTCIPAIALAQFPVAGLGAYDAAMISVLDHTASLTPRMTIASPETSRSLIWAGYLLALIVCTGDAAVGAPADPEVEDSVRALLSCEDLDCEEARRALVGHGDAAVDGLIGILREGRSHRLALGIELPDETLRMRAAGALGELGSGRALDPLLRACRDPSPLLRAEVARAIGRLDATAGTDSLLALLGDSDPLVRESAAGALARSRRADVLEKLRAAVPHEKQRQVRDAFERAIRMLEHP